MKNRTAHEKLLRRFTMGYHRRTDVVTLVKGYKNIERDFTHIFGVFAPGYSEDKGIPLYDKIHFKKSL